MKMLYLLIFTDISIVKLPGFFHCCIVFKINVDNEGLKGGGMVV